ncbi:sulfurtransferase complex subunit TusD [Maricurvus nonylphenolicus]|uniref:sulfurtransferase complex subunit TusD n=1 Tax=Maricurvus nonylphenolicus TaxID=1008307 RepID=UPI0036F1DC69
MKFSIAIYAAPGQQAAYSALRFAQSVIDQGHSIYRLFFYADGVHNSTKLASPPQDEIHLPDQWQAFIQDHNLDAVVCIAAALRRGILDQTEADRYEKDANNLQAGFELSGLGQLVDAAVHSDRIITFG